MRGIERARHRAAAHECRAEAHAFLVAEGGDLNGERQSLAARRQVLHAGDGRQYPEDPVVLAGVAYAVHVRAADHRRRVGMRGFVPPHHVAKRVIGGRHAGSAHQLEDEIARLAMLRREVGASKARSVFGELRERFGLGEYFCSEGHRGWIEPTNCAGPGVLGFAKSTLGGCSAWPRALFSRHIRADRRAFWGCRSVSIPHMPRPRTTG